MKNYIYLTNINFNEVKKDLSNSNKTYIMISIYHRHIHCFINSYTKDSIRYNPDKIAAIPLNTTLNLETKY